MSRYYFHFLNGQTLLDDDGTELTDLRAVRREALRASRELILTDDGTNEFWAGEPSKLWITDGPNASGKTVLMIELCVRETMDADAGAAPKTS
jgi:hypothetical protein